MGLKEIAELNINVLDDRVAVATVLLKNGHTVGPRRRKKSPTGKTLDYFLVVYEGERRESDADVK